MFWSIHRYFKNNIAPNFIILYLSLFSESLFSFLDTTNKIAPVTEIDLNNVLSSDYYASKSNFECVPEFEKLSLRLMSAHNLTFPANIEEANNLLSYISIIEDPWVEGTRIIQRH